MNTLFIYLAAATICVTAIIHSLLGEQKLIQPVLTLRDGPLQFSLARQLIRFAWHFTSVLMLVTAAILLLIADMSAPPARALIGVIGFAYFCVGIFDGILTKGKHIGWWFLTASGGLALASLT